MSRTMRIILVVLMTFTGVSQAQLIRAFGFKVGISFAKHDLEGFILPEEIIRRRTGVTGGLFVEWLNLPVLSLVTQIEYSRRGTGIEITRTDSHGNPAGIFRINSRLDYLSLPVFVKLSESSTAISPYLMGGIRFDYLFDHSQFLEDIYNQFRKGAVGGIVAIGIAPKLSSFFQPLFELRYDLDFTNSFSRKGFEARNNVVNLTLGVGF